MNNFNKVNYEEIELIKEQLKQQQEFDDEIHKKEKVKPKNSKKMIEAMNSEENYEIYFYQSKVDKVVALQKLYPEKIIRELSRNDLFGMEVNDLDCLIDYYQ